MTQAQLNTVALANYSGKNHRLISKAEAEGMLKGTDYECNTRLKYGIPIDTYPENYFFTYSSFEHVEAHVKCGTPFSVNAFFINDEMDSTLLLVSFPVKSIA